VHAGAPTPRALLDSNDTGATEYIDADLRDTGTILTRPRNCSTSPSRLFGGVGASAGLGLGGTRSLAG
jgi:S-adenosyl methyltransferase